MMADAIANSFLLENGEKRSEVTTSERENSQKPSNLTENVFPTMIVSRIKLIGFHLFVFAVAKDCGNVKKMVLNSNRLFSQNEKSVT